MSALAEHTLPPLTHTSQPRSLLWWEPESSREAVSFTADESQHKGEATFFYSALVGIAWSMEQLPGNRSKHSSPLNKTWRWNGAAGPRAVNSTGVCVFRGPQKAKRSDFPTLRTIYVLRTTIGYVPRVQNAAFSPFFVALHRFPTWLSRPAPPRRSCSGRRRQPGWAEWPPLQWKWQKDWIVMLISISFLLRLAWTSAREARLLRRAELPPPTVIQMKVFFFCHLFPNSGLNERRASRARARAPHPNTRRPPDARHPRRRLGNAEAEQTGGFCCDRAVWRCSVFLFASAHQS